MPAKSRPRRKSPESPPGSGTLPPVEPLLAWFDHSARDLPWRRTRDPYAVWISEIMLQQTQVRTVIPYWERWMRELPNVAALAEAAEERVLKLWEGLGYYSRARNLQRAAKRIAARPGGRFPENPAEILELPGIGRYTAGAIASIAFDQAEPILDGNVIRVLTRVLALPGDPKSRPVNEQLWTTASALVRTVAEATASGSRRCARFNQALMELGATVCTPSKPQCGACPWADACSARRLEQVDRFPQIAARPVVTARYFATAVLRHRQRHLVRRRNEDAVNAGFWEFPNVEIAHDDEPGPLIARWLGLSGVEWSRLPDLRHAITRYRITQRVVAATAEPDLRRVSGEWRWVTRRELDALALTGAHRRIARSLDDAC
jgi:A/G-specific adenine glycosylase